MIGAEYHHDFLLTDSEVVECNGKLLDAVEALRLGEGTGYIAGVMPYWFIFRVWFIGREYEVEKIRCWDV